MKNLTERSRDSFSIAVLDAHSLETFRLFLEKRSGNLKNLIVVTLEPEINVDVEEKFPDLVVFDISEFLPMHEIEALQNYSSDLSRRWFRTKNGLDIFECDHISIGLVFQLSIYKACFEAAKIAALLKKFSERYNQPHILLYLENPFPFVTLLQNSFKAMSYTVVKSGNFPRWKFNRQYILDKIKSHFLDWHLKFFFSLVYDYKNRKKRSVQASWARNLILCDIYNKAVLDTLLCVRDSMSPQAREETVTLCVEPRLYRMISMQAGTTCFFTDFFRLPDWVQAGKLLKKKLARWDQYDSEIRANFVFDSISLFPLIRGKLERFRRWGLPQALREFFIVRRILSSNIKNVLLGSDSHKMGRMFALCCREMEINSIVLQHGALYEKWTYTPVTATKIAVWGEYCKKWLTDRGVDAAQIVTAGQPRYDCLFRYSPKVSEGQIKSSLALSQSEPFILIGATSLPRDQNTEFFKIISEGLKRYSKEFKVVVKLKPSEPQWEFFKEITERFGLKNCRFTADTDLFSLLHASHLIITCASTIGLEALMLNKPLVVVEVSGQEEMIPYRQYDAAFLTNSGKELEMAIDEIVQRSQIYRQKQANGKTLIREYIGDIDGSASHRVLDLMA